MSIGTCEPHHAGVSMQMFEPADNIDLLAVVQEWEEYYEMRFARKPKLARDHVER